MTILPKIEHLINNISKIDYSIQPSNLGTIITDLDEMKINKTFILKINSIYNNLQYNVPLQLVSIEREDMYTFTTLENIGSSNSGDCYAIQRNDLMYDLINNNKLYDI
jgi:hypothetical protein